MNADEYLKSDAYIQQIILEELLGMVNYPFHVVKLETIRRNPVLHRYSDEQIFRAISKLIDQGLFNLCQRNPSSKQLRNGYIIRRA